LSILTQREANARKVIGMSSSGTLSEAPVPVASRAGIERLKIACFSAGVAVSVEVLEALGGSDALTVHEYATTGGVTLRVAGLYINAPFDTPESANSPVALIQIDGNFTLTFEGQRFPIERVVPLPGYLNSRLSTGRLAGDVVMSHGDRIRLSPIKGCVYDCAFCDLGALRYERRQLPELIEALDIAMRDPFLPPRHVLISGGSPGPSHVEWFNELCAGIVQYSSLPVDIMFSPQYLGADTIDQLVDAGINSVSINIELFDEDAAQQHLSRKRDGVAPYFEETVRRAVELMPEPGRVRSLIIPGLESESSTIAGIDYLASLGVHPVISPFRPAQDTRLVHHAAADAGLLRRVLDAARKIAVDNDVALGPACEYCQHNTLTFPWDTHGISEFHR
jgi:hypothetical protein